MGLLVFLFSNLWGNRLGAAFAASILFNVDSGRSTCQTAAFYLGGNLFKEFPHGVFLEHVCRSTFFPLAVWKTVPSLIFLQIKHRIHPAA